MKTTIIGLALAASAAFVQQPPQGPQPDVFLASLDLSGGKVAVGTPVNVSNSAGYDNQPFFLADSSGLLFSSNRDASQNDIFRYDIGSKKVSQVTKTEENEYSPTVMAGGKTFSVVRGVEQQLWQFDLDGNNARLAYAHTGKIGYHAWLSPTTIAVFVLGSGQGQPSTLEFVDTDSTKKPEVVEKSIGRSILNRPGKGTVSYIATASRPYLIKEFDPKTKKTSTIVKTLGDQEFCAWLPDGGGLLTSQGAKLFVWRPGAADWTEVADLSAAKLAGISRLAVSPNGRWLAIVANPVQ